MKIRQFGIIAFTLLALTGAAVAGAADEAAQTSASLQAPCCFENPRFTGTCEVTPGPEESCGGILAYLNNPNSTGKNYCGNTKVRGGWTQVDCEGDTATTMCAVPTDRD
jgi:hypothetical protein